MPRPGAGRPRTPSTDSWAVDSIYYGGGHMHSHGETFRGTVQVRSLNDELHTVIVLRRGLGSDARVWLTLNGAWKTTVSMADPEVSQLCELLIKAQQARAR